MIASACLYVLIVIAAVTDFKYRKIYNAITYPGMLIALALNGLGELLERQATVPEDQLRFVLGQIGFGESVLGLLACGIPMLFCYVIFGIGAGDVKMMAMIGAFLGVERGLEALLWTFVLAGCLGIIALTWSVGLGRALKRAAGQMLYFLKYRGWAELTPDERALLDFPWYMAPTALAAVVLVQLDLAH